MTSSLNVIFPFNSGLSENNRLAWSPRNNRMFAKNDYKRAQNGLILLIKFAMAQQKPKFNPNGRIFVDLKVYRPNRRTDCSNFIKSVNDAVARAIGIDDKNYDGSYHGFTDKENPRFVIEVRQ